MTYHYPETKEEWWQTVEEYWPSLRSILYRYLPLYENLKINEGEGERVIWSEKPMSQLIEELKEQRNDQLARYFFAAWDSAPDQPSVRDNHGWNILCDLLSEEGVLYEEQP